MTTETSFARVHHIEPFWQRLPRISLYPLQGASLATIVVLSAARVVSLLPGFLGLILNLLITVALYKFAAEVLWRTANGKMTPPEIVGSDSNLGWLQVQVQIVLWLLIILSIFILGPALGTIAVIFIALGAPGAMMSAAIEQSLGRAINPATWIAMMTRLGWPYFVVALLCGVFMLSEANAQAFVVPHLPALLAVIVFYAISHYVTIATFHLMGYLVYQYHDELGFEVEAAPELPRRPGVGADADQQLLDEAEALVREDRTVDAEALLREQINTRGGSPALHQRYRKLLGLRGDVDALRRHTNEYLNVLIAQDDLRRAVELVRDMQEREPAYKPTSPEYVGRIAKRAADTGQSQVALRLLSGFHKAYPKHKEIPANYLLAARLLAEKMNREDQAKVLLQQVREQFPQHALIPEVEAYLRFLEGLTPVGGAPKKITPPPAS
jgi:hypothetical protein